MATGCHQISLINICAYGMHLRCLTYSNCYDLTIFKNYYYLFLLFVAYFTLYYWKWNLKPKTTLRRHRIWSKSSRSPGCPKEDASSSSHLGSTAIILAWCLCRKVLRLRLNLFTPHICFALRISCVCLFTLHVSWSMQMVSFANRGGKTAIENMKTWILAEALPLPSLFAPPSTENTPPLPLTPVHNYPLQLIWIN